jgi:hypothetical protein
MIIINIIQLLIVIFQILLVLKPIIELIIKIIESFTNPSKAGELAIITGLSIISVTLWLLQTIPFRLLQPLLTKKIMVVCENSQQVLC